MADLSLRKSFPADYPQDVLSILYKMSLTNGLGIKLLGSMSLRSQPYAGDYDAYEVVPTKGKLESAVKAMATRFQKALRDLMDTKNVYIGDIKTGSIEEWKVLHGSIRNGKVVGYNATQSRKKVEELYDSKIINEAEYEKSMELLKDTLTPLEFLDAQREIRYNILRWLPKEVLRGYKILTDGRKFTLEEAFQTPTITKLDVVAWVQGNRFTDFSCIYEFKHNGKTLNPAMVNVGKALLENIYALYYEKDYFKMAKRMFAYAKFRNDKKTMATLQPLFVGDLGRIYLVYGDIGTLEFLIENESDLPYEKMDFEIDQFKGRLANITLPKYLANESMIADAIDKVVNLRNYAKNNAQMLKLLGDIKEYLKKMLTFYSKEFLVEQRMFPPPMLRDLFGALAGGAKGEVSEITKDFYAKQSMEERQKLGQFYTPKALINKTFETIDISKDAPVLEPTAGSGEFVKQLLERGFTDITANEFADVPYQILLKEYAPQGVKITQGDYLLKEFPTKFDLVIGNPPYFMFKGKHGTISKEVATKYKDVIKGTANIYVLSVVKGLMDLKDGGILSYVIPTSILTSPMFQKARNWIALRSNIERVEVHSQKDEFEGANVEVMIFQLRKTSTPNMDYKRKTGENYVFLKSKEGRVVETAEGTETIGSLAKFKTGGVDIAKIPKEDREKLLSSTISDQVYPIIYGENIFDEGVKEDAKIKKGRSQYLSKDYKPSSAIEPPFLIAKRTIGTKKDLKVALVETGRSAKYYPENHTYWAKGKIEDLRRIHAVLTAKERPFLDDVNSLSISSELLNSVVIPPIKTERVGDFAKFQYGTITPSKIPADKWVDSADEGIVFIYGENIKDNQLKRDTKLKTGRRQFVKADYAPTKLITAPFLVVKRITGGGKKFGIAYVAEGSAYTDKNTLLYATGKAEDLRKVYEGLTKDGYATRFMKGVDANAINREYLESLPLDPSRYEDM